MGHYEILGLELALENGRVTGEVTGTLAKALRGYFQIYLTRLNQNRALAQRRGGNVYTLYLPPIPGKASVEDLTRKLLRKMFNQVIPSTCTLQTTNRCQAKCVHCSAALHMARNDRPEIDTQQFKKAIDEATGLGVVNVTLSGGEPLLRPDIYEICAHVDPDKASCAIFTNGELLTKENVGRLADANTFSVMVSLDSPVAEEHDALRGRPGLFEKAVDGIRNLLETEVLVGISTYATHENLADGKLERIVELGRELGVHEVTIFDAVPTGKYLRNTECMLSPEERERVRQLTIKWRNDSRYPGVISMAWVNSPHGSGCFAANEQFYMTASGDIGPCDFTPFTFGNITEEPLSTIWKRMISHPAYCKPHNSCRMQDPAFRRQYVDPIADGTPVPIELWKHPEMFPSPDGGGFVPSGHSKGSPSAEDTSSIGI